MDALTSQAADKLVSEVRGAYLRGAARVGFNQADAEQLLRLGAAATLSWSWIPLTEQARRTETLMRQLGGAITQWATVYRGWAERGARDDGSAYSWAKWEAYGREDLSPDIKNTTQLALDEAVFNLFKTQVVDKTAKELADVALPWRWPVGVQVLAGVAGLVVVAVVLRPYLAPLLNRGS